MGAPKLDNAQDPYEDNLRRKSILFAGLLKLKFWLLGRSTTVYGLKG